MNIFSCAVWPVIIAAQVTLSAAVELIETKQVNYRPTATADETMKARCQLDVYQAKGATDLPILLWFHGGGLTGGSKDSEETVAAARALAQRGVIVVTVNYRLSPQVKYPAYIEDAAAAFQWVHQHAQDYGGSVKKIFLGGHSAGGYLVLMLGSDQRWLATHQLVITEIAGVISLSGQTVTHYTVRAERGLSDTTIVVDQAAPLFYASAPCPPQLILYAEKDMEMRVEENMLYLAARKKAGRKEVTGQQVKDRDHGSIGGRIGQLGDQVQQLIVDFITAPKNAK
jgi:acetyl esterase/lipase